MPVPSPTIRQNFLDSSIASSTEAALTIAQPTTASLASVYGPSRGLMEKHFSRFGVESTYVDTSNIAQVRDALRPNTKLVYIETPANPTMQLTDIAEVAKLAHAHGCLLAVDNTFASPYLQKPLELGADVVLHSVTKFINGHADVVGGIRYAGGCAPPEDLQ